MASFTANKDGSETFTPSSPVAKVVEFSAKNDPMAFTEAPPEDVPAWDKSAAPAKPAKGSRKG
jgi:hypothetical protein